MSEPSLAKIAEEAAREPHSWTLVVCNDGTEFGTAQTIADELLYPLEAGDPGGGVVHRIEATGEFPDAIRGLSTRDAAIVTGIERLSTGELSHLDLMRNRMVGRARVVIVLPRGATARARQALPNVWSLFGARIWVVTGVPEVLNAEERLVALRAAHGMTDPQVVAMAESGELPTDPPFVEWIILLGRGDLLRD